ncbi:MAG: CGP-CTERM sorting domain-containing protein [Cyclobacteriaceae bacterium]|nr:CGP-CTERM sorting domain-containing protein [Cyclobacteriaceae bacterium]
MLNNNPALFVLLALLPKALNKR